MVQNNVGVFALHSLVLCGQAIILAQGIIACSISALTRLAFNIDSGHRIAIQRCLGCTHSFQ